MAGLVASLNRLNALPFGTKSLAETLTEPSRSELSNAGGFGGLSLRNALSDYLPLSPTPHPVANALAGLPPPPVPSGSPALALGLLKPKTKRKAYFAFRLQDIMRVNTVRQAWCVDHPNSAALRSFYDRSIWGANAPRDDETLKTLMRHGVECSSAVCVLIGANTWNSRWVKYEIARAVIDERGLLGEHINRLRPAERKTPDTRGYSPLHCMGVYSSSKGRFYLYEKLAEVLDARTGELGWAWRPYEDFKDPVPLPRYMPSIAQGFVTPLATYTAEYDYGGGSGHENIGAWIDRAAAAVGR
jgi:hypothetical protein